MIDKKIIKYQLNSIGFILGLLMVLNIFMKIFSQGFLPIYSPFILILIISLNRYYGRSLTGLSVYSLVSIDRRKFFLSQLAYLLILAGIMLGLRSLIEIFFFKNELGLGRISLLGFFLSGDRRLLAVRRGFMLKNIYRLVEYFIIVAASILIYSLGRLSGQPIERKTGGRIGAGRVTNIILYLALRTFLVMGLPLAFIYKNKDSQKLVGSRSFIISSKTLGLVDPGELKRGFVFISNSSGLSRLDGSYSFSGLGREVVYLNLGNLVGLFGLGLLMVLLTYGIYRRKNEL